MLEVVLVVNPGSTSTKAAVCSRAGPTSSSTVRHQADALAAFGKVTDQLALRSAALNEYFASAVGPDMKIVGVAGRGGPLKPLEGGTYAVNEAMLRDLRSGKYSNHASNLGAVIADELARAHGVGAYVTDPVTTDELAPEARISGVQSIERKSRAHVLNIKANARRAAAAIGKPLSLLDLVVCHMGGGISVCALRAGRMVDVNDALLGMGPFSPERAGALPIGPLARLCFEGKMTLAQVEDLLSRRSGLLGYLGTTDLQEVERRVAGGDEKASLVFRAMAYQIAKEIGAMFAVLRGRADAIVFTGGMANSRMLLDAIQGHVSGLARVIEQPGELEMEALAEGAFRVIDGVEEALEYS